MEGKRKTARDAAPKVTIPALKETEEAGEASEAEMNLGNRESHPS